ncbi:MAG: aldo/keto reductase [Actinomycetia bacterium]|nr:aldo/keto reductase [Actinomycetes bacterium]
MKYRALGRTGLQVSELGVGTLTFGRGAGALAKVDQPTADRMVHRALDAGVNLFDTADNYHAGQSEEILGHALGERRADVLVSTKVGGRVSNRVNSGGLSYAHIVASCETSAQRLGTDWIDILNVAEPDPQTPFEETARALDDVVRRGLVRYVGFSHFPAWEAALAIGSQWAHNLRPFSTIVQYYSLVGREAERDVLPLAERAGLGVIVASPLAGGFLTGKYDRSGGTIEDRRTAWPFPAVDATTGHAVTETLRGVSHELDATPAQVAIAWLLTRPVVSSVLIGASSIRQLYENIRASEFTLTEDHQRRLDALVAVPTPDSDAWRAVFFDDDVLDELRLP